MVFFLLGITLINAQETYTVSGTVYDFHDKTLLHEAKIQLGNYSVVSDKKGEFILKNIKKGSYNLSVSHPDCEPFYEQIMVDKDLDLMLNLEHHIHEIESVTIHGNHKNSGSMIVKTVDKTEISRNSTENLGNLLTQISGVTALKTGNNISKPVIHGLYGSRISVINNGVKMAEQEWGVEHAPNIDVNFFDHIDVIKGASALKYGNEVIGGVVVLEPKVLPKKDTLMGSLGFSGISNGKGGEITADISKIWENQWFVKSGGSFKKLGDLYIPHHTLQNTGAEVNSFNFSLGNRSFMQGFEVSYSGINQKFGIFKGAHLGSPEDFYKAVNFGQPYYLDDFKYDIENPKQEVSHHIAKISAYKRFENFGKLSFQYSFQLNHRKEYDIRRGAELSKLPSMDLQLVTHSASLTHLIEREKWQLESGISGNIQDNYPNPVTKARRLIPDYYRYDAGIFSVFQYRFNPVFKAEIGARYDFSRYDSYKYYDASEWETKYAAAFSRFFVSKNDSRILTHPVLDYHNFSANVGLDYNSGKFLHLKLNLSRTSRTPNPAELFADGLHHSAAIMETGNLTTKKEEVYQINLLAKTQLDFLKGFQVEINPYLMYSENFINQIPTDVKSTNRGVFPVWDYQQIKARIIGIDIDSQLRILENLKWNGNFSALKGDDLSHGEPLILMMPAKFRNALEFNLDKPTNFYLRIENETALKQKHFPIRNVNISFIENGTEAMREVDYSSSPDSYSVFNAAIGMNISKNINLNFRLNNIFNTEYREYLNRLRYFMPEPGRNFIITAKINF